MTIRPVIEKDIIRIDEYCKKHDIRTPLNGLCFIAEDEYGIVGIIGGIPRMIIEPMIADSPLIARRLYDTLMGAIAMTAQKVIWMTPKSEILTQEAEKLDFVIIDKNVTILEKVMNNGQ